MDIMIPTTSMTGKQQINCPPAAIEAVIAGDVFPYKVGLGHIYSVAKASTIVKGKLINSPILAVIAPIVTKSFELILCLEADRADNRPAKKNVKTFNARISIVKRIEIACLSCVFNEFII